MATEQSRLQAAYARVTGLKHSTPATANVSGVFGEDVNQIVESVAPIMGDVAQSFMMPRNGIWAGGGGRGDTYCDSRVVHAKLGQLISYLEHMFHVNSKIIEIGSLYNSIRDQELRNRCSDLLSAADHFDRVINQATLVLEDRIRMKSGVDKPMVGVQLVNTVLNADVSRTVLRISDNAEEHEGVCHICRGMMLTFRNPTHHHVIDKFTREDALKVCAFIDNLLQLVDQAIVTAK
jgi:uncharacterized protein (TIGR02391 family)